jgi:hypothetical protein
MMRRGEAAEQARRGAPRLSLPPPVIAPTVIAPVVIARSDSDAAIHFARRIRPLPSRRSS